MSRSKHSKESEKRRDSKSSGADRKHRSESKRRDEKHKHKRSSGSSSSSRAEKKQRKKQRALSKLLDWGLVHLQYVFDEVLSLYQSLHDGEYVTIDAVSNPQKRGFLEQLMELLPVRQHSSLGYYKEAVDTNISGVFAAYLRKQHGIDSSSSSSSSSGSSGTTNVSMIAVRQSYLPRLLTLLENNPQLRGELEPLLQHILGGSEGRRGGDNSDDEESDASDSSGSSRSSTHSDGGAVNVEELENDEVRVDLERLFVALGLEKTDGSYAIPRRHGSARTAATAAVRRVQQMLQRAASYQKRIEKKQKHAERQASKAASSASESAASIAGVDVANAAECRDDDGGDSSGGTADSAAATQRLPIGPSMPTAQQLQYAAAAAASAAALGKDSSDDDDDVMGPQLYDPRNADRATAQRLQSAMQQPLGFTGVDLPAAFTAPQPADAASADPASAVDEAAATATNTSEREEWLLTPGENKLIAELNGGLPTNRKFETGKQAKKRADELAIRREHVRQQQELMNSQKLLPSEVAQREADAAAAAAAAAAAKGPSLMEEHMQQHVGKFSGAQVPAKKRQREAFDYERDIASRKRLDSHAVHRLVEDAKQLDNRFDKGSVQRSF